MKWLLAALAVCVMVGPAMAGEDPYMAIVGTDCVPGSFNFYNVCPTTPDPASGNVVGAADPYFFSPKQQLFMYNENDPGTFAIPVRFGTFPGWSQYTRVGGPGQESFLSQTLNNQAEVCYYPNGNPFSPPHIKTARTPAGNAGFYEWWIRLPKKPSGEINIVLQCGILKPNAFAAYGSESIELCAGETGERIGYGTCVRQEVDPGTNPVNTLALPTLTAMAYPGPYNVAFVPFHLTAFKNPGSYVISFASVTFQIQANSSDQVLDGSTNSRILLKACMDKTVVTKLPVTGQMNAAGDTENDLEAGDMIQVRLDVPRYNSVDVYCGQESVRLAGVGETVF